MKPTNSIKIVDRGWAKIMENNKLLKKAYTKVGFPSDATLSQTALSKYSDVSEVASVAMFQEFGTVQEVTGKQSAYLTAQGFPIRVGARITNPPRPFMSTSFDENVEKIHRMAAKILRSMTESGISVKQGLAILGELGVDLVRKKIKSIDSPPLHPFTIAQRAKRSVGSSKPLVDTGQMVQSVTHTEIIA
jgi:hypothetical protein